MVAGKRGFTKRNMFQVVVILLFLSTVCSGLTPKKNSRTKSTVREKGLVVGKDVPSSSILRNYKTVNTKLPKTFEGATLGFVTPWNNKGYDIAKNLNSKFTYVSPVWYQIHPNNGKSELKGQHDVDQNWINNVRTANMFSTDKPKVLPRILFEGWAEDDYLFLGRNYNPMEETVTLVVEECKKERFDGFVLDFSYIHFGGYGGAVTRLIKKIGDELHRNDKELILVVPPYMPQYPLFVSNDYLTLYNYVDQFIIMTYDYSSGSKNEKGGPSAPSNWMMQSVLNILPPSSRSNEDHKLLLGLNFFGTTFCSQGHVPIIGDQFIEIIETFNPTLKWDAKNQEHSFSYSHDELEWTAYYPTLKYINDRLQLAESLNIGISIWELGQGLNYFYDLL